MNIPLARTRKGLMIHHRHCSQITRNTPGLKHHAMPWLWADDKSEAEVATWVARLGYSTCKHCNPIPWHDMAVVALIKGLVPVCLGSHVEGCEV